MPGTFQETMVSSILGEFCSLPVSSDLDLKPQLGFIKVVLDMPLNSSLYPPNQDHAHPTWRREEYSHHWTGTGADRPPTRQLLRLSEAAFPGTHFWSERYFFSNESQFPEQNGGSKSSNWTGGPKMELNVCKRAAWSFLYLPWTLRT